MYGYIRPFRDELKIREYELFRGAYCGLCHTLKRRYGPLGRFLVNYDFTFLAMLLSERTQETLCPKRCPYHPLRRTGCPEASRGMDTAADETVILAWWKLRDSAADSSGIKSLAAKLGCGVLRRAYKKASLRCPEFVGCVQSHLQELAALEDAHSDSLDRTADTFANILRGAAAAEPDERRRRVLGELLYHTGRIVYLLDAADDLERDAYYENYNPLLYRYEVQDGRLSDDDSAQLRLTLQHSHNAIASAFALLDESAYTGIIANTIYYGMPAVTQSVFAGTWNRRAARKERKSL